VRFDDGEVRDDICLDSAHTLVRFDAAAYHAVLEVQYDGSWSRKAGAMIKGSVVWGVAFEDGNWAEDMRREVQGSRCGQAESGTRRMERKPREIMQESVRTNARRAVRPSRGPATWLCTCGYTAESGHAKVRRAARPSRNLVMW